VLFIGNSHTYTNDLPALVRKLACAAGTKLVTQAVTPGGVGLSEHAADPATLAAIAADAGDFVLLQDQQQRPSFRLEQGDWSSVPSARTLVDAIRSNRAATRPLFFMVWARVAGDTSNCANYPNNYYPLICTFEGDTRAVADGYRLYAERTNSELAPVALAWAAVRADANAALPPLNLWAADGSHPALPGSYLAAAVIVGTMLDTSTAALPDDGGLDPPVAAYLRTLADRIVAAEKADPRVSTRAQVYMIRNTNNPLCDYNADGTAGDGAPVTITLSADSCADLRNGVATASGRIHTTASCFGGFLEITVPLGGWHEVPGAVIADGVYQVHVHIDLDRDGLLSSGDLEACREGAFVVGTDAALVLSDAELSAR
jgi:hypothetical protein